MRKTAQRLPQQRLEPKQELFRWLRSLVPHFFWFLAVRLPRFVMRQDVALRLLIQHVDIVVCQVDKTTGSLYQPPPRRVNFSRSSRSTSSSDIRLTASCTLLASFVVSTRRSAAATIAAALSSVRCWSAFLYPSNSRLIQIALPQRRIELSV